MQYFCLNGELVPAAEARLDVSDLGLLRGYGIFDFFPVVDGVPVFLEDYLARLENSARLMDLDLPVLGEELRSLVLTTIDANGAGNAYIRLLLTGGEAENSYTPTKPNFVIMYYDYEQFRAGFSVGGLKLMTDLYVRELPEAKSTNYAHVIRLRKKLAQLGASDVLYHDGRLITESSRSNFFVFMPDGRLVTPERHILPGVTRKNLLRVAREHFEVEVRDLHFEELREASEAFLCSTMRGVSPVFQIDELTIGSGQPGRYSQQLAAVFQAYRQQYLAQAREARM
jgi:D-alanine transaminase/branched-chain amino acid aminotransferase